MTCGFTANTTILSSPEFRQATPYNAAFAESMDHLRDFWNIPQYNELLEVAQRQIGAALDGGDSQAALNSIAKEHEAIMREGGFLK